jgi:hypothetical protein
MNLKRLLRALHSMDINSVGRVLFYSSTQVTVGAFSGAALEYLFALSPADYTNINCPTDALLASVEVLGQLALSCLCAGIIYNKLLKMPPEKADPAQGVGLVFGLIYSQMKLSVKIRRLIDYFKRLLGLVDPGVAADFKPDTATTLPATQTMTTRTQTNLRGLPAAQI